MDMKLFKAFVDGTIKTLSVQATIEAKPGKPFYKGEKQQPEFGIAGVVGITSQAFTGSIILCFPVHVFLKIMSSMLGENYKEMSPELADGAGELINIIYGQAKQVLNAQGYSLDMALPSVIQGNQIGVSHHTHDPVIVLPFQVGDGEFHIEIGAKKRKEEKAA